MAQYSIVNTSWIPLGLRSKFLSGSITDNVDYRQLETAAYCFEDFFPRRTAPITLYEFLYPTWTFLIMPLFVCFGTLTFYLLTSVNVKEKKTATQTTPYSGSHLGQFLVEFCSITFPFVALSCSYVVGIPWVAVPTTAVATPLVLFIGRAALSSGKARASTMWGTAPRVKLLTDMPKQGRIPFLSELRSALTVGTCIAILAVDFCTFPRQLSKSGDFGYTFMDHGVGVVTFVSAMLCRFSDPSADSHKRSLVKLSSSSAIVAILGFTAFAAKYSSGYHTPPTEYGTHWNFFFTISLVTLVTDVVVHRIVSPGNAWILGLGCSGVYQVILSLTNFQSFMLHAPRENFLSANREGVFGCIGFIAIRLIGISYGRCLRHMARRSSAIKTVLITFTMICLCFMSCAVLNFAAGILPSRRMANLPFVIYSIAANLITLLVFLLTDWAVSCLGIVRFQSNVVLGVEKYNLHCFLLANVLTGAVKLITGQRPLTVNPLSAIAIVTMYSVVWSWAVYCAGCGVFEKFLCLKSFPGAVKAKAAD